MNKARKALAAPLAPVLLALLLWVSTGTLNIEELAVALSGLIAAIVVFYVPNDSVHPPHETQADPENEST